MASKLAGASLGCGRRPREQVGPRAAEPRRVRSTRRFVRSAVLGRFEVGFELLLQAAEGAGVELRHPRLADAELVGDGAKAVILEVVEADDELLALGEHLDGLGDEGAAGGLLE